MTPFEYPRLGEKLYKQILPNGLTLMVVPRPVFTRKLAYFVTDFGSIHTDFTLEGKETNTLQTCIQPTFLKDFRCAL